YVCEQEGESTRGGTPLVYEEDLSRVMQQSQYSTLFERQRQLFVTGKTRGYDFIIASLRTLDAELHKREREIIDALWADFRKPAAETLVSELGIVHQEIAYIRSKLKSWRRATRVRTPLLLAFARSYHRYEPHGNTLIISPWNYPLQLALSPLVAAVAAGNCVILKPSEYTPHTNKVLQAIIAQCFAPEHVAILCLDAQQSEELLALPFDYIFFTGSTRVGRIVAQKAALNLTPLTLELGGKSPAVVAADAPLPIVAQRLVWAKFFNCGQSCIAPDYLLVHAKVKEAFIALLQQTITAFYGQDPKNSDDYGRIIHPQSHQRLVALLTTGKVICGGEHDVDARFIAPTLMEDCDLNAEIMREEIFGPILPIFVYREREEAMALINKVSATPLAAYVFSQSEEFISYFNAGVAYGSGCINDALIQYGSYRLPFGGKGLSGMGKSRGKHGFVSFSHQKATTRRSLRFELPLRFPPYRHTWMLRMALKLLKRL
ncbi:MAG: aldehyde dehydrogenase family protein, partial [Pseudomonadota bacterium]|nr:aldehyde dehydrogenase family protein [Pseudomonadota bacterium]